jgi:predicted Rossmann fold flavoprotein
MKIYDVIVIGGGPAGIFASGTAAKNGAEVLLLEKNSSLGKKLLITGKGRCNITNSGDIKSFVKNYDKNGEFLYRAFSEFFNTDLINFFEHYGVKTTVERGGRIFPVNNNSEEILSVLKNF